MKPSTIIILTLLGLASTLTMPWTEVEYWEASDGSLWDPDAKRSVTPYLFMYEEANTSKEIRWNYTLVQAVIVGLVGAAFYIHRRANPIPSYGGSTPTLPKAAPHPLVPTNGAAVVLVIILFLIVWRWFG